MDANFGTLVAEDSVTFVRVDVQFVKGFMLYFFFSWYLKSCNSIILSSTRVS